MLVAFSEVLHNRVKISSPGIPSSVDNALFPDATGWLQIVWVDSRPNMGRKVDTAKGKRMNSSSLAIARLISSAYGSLASRLAKPRRPRGPFSLGRFSLSWTPGFLFN